MSGGEGGQAGPLHGQWRLLAPALLCWAVAAAVIHLPGYGAAVAALSGGVGLTLCLAWAWRGRARARRPRKKGALAGFLLLCCAALVLLGGRVASLEQARADPRLSAAATTQRPVALTVRLAGYPATTEGQRGDERGWVRARIDGVAGVGLRACVSAMLWLPDAPPRDWHPGAHIRVRATLAAGQPQDLAAYEVRVSKYARETPEHGVTTHTGREAAALRASLHDAAAERVDAELVPGLAVGDTSLVGDELDRVMLDANLTHLTAVSGSNCALVVTAITSLAARIGCGRRLRIMLAAAALGGFVVVVGPDASVQRAAVMAGVLLLANFGGKRGQALPALGLATLTLLVADPWQAIQPGFALSVVATGGILLCCAPLEHWLRRRARLPRVLALPLAVAVVAQLVCAPLLLLLQPGLSFGGILANLLAAPAAPAGTVLGMLALLSLPVAPGVGDALLALAVWPARWIAAAGHVGAALPGGRWYWPGGWGGAVVLAAVYLLAGVAWMVMSGWVGNRPGQRVPWRRGRIPLPHSSRLLVGGASGIAAGVVIAIVLVVPAGVRAGVPGDWSVAACDVGQGDAVLLRDPTHPDTVMLVDTGEFPDLLDACLDLFGVRSIALLVITHHHADHMGALSVALPKSRSIIVGPASLEEAGGPSLAELVAAQGREANIGKRGMRGGQADGLRWEVLGPAPQEAYAGANGASLVLRVETGGLGVLLLGDSGEPEHRELLRSFPGLSAELVKVAHHGSKDQAIELYEHVGAAFGIFSSGEGNSYGHPNPGLVTTLAAMGTVPLRTDELGSIALRTTPGGVEVWAAGERSALLGREHRRPGVRCSR